MTEAEWLECDDLEKMLRVARFHSSRQKSRLFAARKSRLFATACCRLIWPCFVDERSRRAIEVAERYADASASEEELTAAWQGAEQAHREMYDVVGKCGAHIEWAAELAAGPDPFLGAKAAAWMTVS